MKRSNSSTDTGIQMVEIEHFVPPPEQLRAARDLLGWTPAETLRAVRHIDLVWMTETQLAVLETNPRGGQHLFRLIDTYKQAGIAFRSIGIKSKQSLGDIYNQHYQVRLTTPWMNCVRSDGRPVVNKMGAA